MQTNEEHIEQQLWEYIDGFCNDKERSRIAVLIAEDNTWKTKYEELLSLHSGIVDNAELEHPPLRFTKNVMDTIARVHPVVVPKKYTHPAFVRGIAAFFIITTCLLLVYTLLTTDWNTSANGITATRYSLPKVNVHSLLNGNLFTVTVAATVIAGLALLDTVARAKWAQRHS